MKEIIKYQLKGRKNSIVLILAIFAGVNALALTIDAIAFSRGGIEPGQAFWTFVASTVTGVLTTVMFFLCGSGHVRELLYRDSAYLMLTVPRRGWEILGGRFIAGLAEFALYAVAAALFASAHIAFFGSMALGIGHSPLEVLSSLYGKFLAQNLGVAAKTLLIGLTFYALTGSLVTFAAVASRSFVKNKKIATAVAIAIFFIVANWASKLGIFVSERLHWFWDINIVPIDGMRPFFDASLTPVPMGAIALAVLLAVALFAAASWLLERKVEI